MPETPKAHAAAFRNSHFFLLLGWMTYFILRITRGSERIHRLLRQHDR